MDLNSLLYDGYVNLQKKYQAREESKENLWRAGSSGCYDGEKFYGSCPRLAVLRKEKILPELI